MGSYNKIILLAFMMLPLFTASIAVGGLQAAYGGGGGGTCTMDNDCIGDTSECQKNICNLTSGFCEVFSLDEGTACGDSSETECDEADTCNGVGDCQDNLEASNTLCRPSSGTCDVAEFCTGVSAVCPADGVAAPGTACGDPSDTECDNPDSCFSGVCEDNFEPNDTVCRVTADICDVAETCTGSTPLCPADGFAASSTVCRESTGVCDVEDFCDGSSASCPDDAFADAGTACTCSEGPGTCDGSNVCNADILIDIKPGSDPNCISVKKRGLTTIAILGSDSFDVTTIDQSTIMLDDNPGNVISPTKIKVKDVNSDGEDDLVLKFSTVEMKNQGFLVDNNEIFVTGELLDGTPFANSDIINLAGGPNCF